MKISQHLVDLFDLKDKTGMQVVLQGFENERDIIVVIRNTTGHLVSRIQKIAEYENEIK